MKNYRPVSNLSFISKLLERVAQIRLQEFLDSNNMMPGTQSIAPRQQLPRCTVIFFWPLTTVMSLHGAYSTWLLRLTPSTTTFWSVSSVYAASSCNGFALISLAEHLKSSTPIAIKSSVVIICCSVSQGSVLGPRISLYYIRRTLETQLQHMMWDSTPTPMTLNST